MKSWMRLSSLSIGLGSFRWGLGILMGSLFRPQPGMCLNTLMQRIAQIWQECWFVLHLLCLTAYQVLSLEWLSKSNRCDKNKINNDDDINLFQLKKIKITVTILTILMIIGLKKNSLGAGTDRNCWNVSAIVLMKNTIAVMIWIILIRKEGKEEMIDKSKKKKKTNKHTKK